jgi:prepilin peptidase CpaA
MLFAGISRAVLASLLVVAALWDIRKRRIPNVLSAAVVLSGLVTALIGEGGWAALSALAALVVTIGVGWIPWLRGWIGGGDIKLAGAAAVWVGLRLLHEYLLATALVGAVVAGICYFLSTRQARREMLTNLKMAAAGVMPEPALRSGGGRVSVPYGVACAVAALAIVLIRKGW